MNKVNHCRIRSKHERGQIKYYLIEGATFDSLYSLITYYRTYALRIQVNIDSLIKHFMFKFKYLLLIILYLII